MKKILNYLVIALSVLLVFSCGEKGMTPKSSKISGPLRDYYQVVDRLYKTAGDGTVYIELKRIKDGLPEPWKAEYGTVVGWNDGEVEPGLSVEYFDKNGNIVGKTKTLDLGGSLFAEDKDNLQNLVNLSVGESCAIRFSLPSNDVVQFSLASNFEYHPLKKVVKMSAQDEAKYMEMIDKYEGLVNRFISIQKTEERFDMSLYEEAMNLANTINESMDNASSDLEERFSVLERTFSNAALFGSKPDKE